MRACFRRKSHISWISWGINFRLLVSRPQCEHIAKLCPTSQKQNIMSCLSRAKPGAVNVALLSTPESINFTQLKITNFSWQCYASATQAFGVKQGKEREFFRKFFHCFGSWVRPTGHSRQKYKNVETAGLWGRKAFLAHSEKNRVTRRMNCKGKNTPWRDMTKIKNVNESGHRETSFYLNL